MLSSGNNFAKAVADKNRRVATKWQQLAKAIDVQQTEKGSQLTEHRNKLLSQRDDMQARTVSLSTAKDAEAKEMKSFHSVCDALLTSLRKSRETKSTAQQRSSARLQKPTQSSDKKKVSRKTASFSLKELKQKSEAGQIRKEKAQRTRSEGASSVPAINISNTLSLRRPKSAFDMTEEEQLMNRKLYSCPTALPRIYQQSEHRPKRRNFSKDEDFFKRVSVTEDSWRDIHHCRHLRIQPLKRSFTVPDLRSATMR